MIVAWFISRNVVVVGIALARFLPSDSTWNTGAITKNLRVRY